MEQIVSGYTSVTKDSMILIDYCVTNIPQLCAKTNPKLNISDHDCIVCECLVNCVDKTKNFKQIEYLKKNDKSDLINELNKDDLGAML